MRLHPYGKYIKTELYWVKEIPESWGIKTNREVWVERNRRDNYGLQLLSVTIRNGVIKQETLLKNSSRKDASNTDKSKYKLVVPNDIVYNKMRMWQGAVGSSIHEGIVSPAYIVLRPLAPINSKYYHYLLRTPAYINESNRSSYGICDDQLSLRYEDFKKMKILYPPIQEQNKIVAFLDYHLKKINRLINQKKKLSALLLEQKHSVINKIIMNGLDTKVEVKPSGVKWLGDIPIDWKVIRLGGFVNILPGFAFPSDGFTTNKTDVPLLRGINVAPGELRWDDVVYWSKEYDKNFDLRASDIVLGMDRPLISSGVRVAMVKETDVPSILLQRVARLRSKGELHQEYLYHVLSSKAFIEYLQPLFSGISVPHISRDQIRTFKIPLPPLEEQLNLITAIHESTSKIEQAMSLIHAEIKLIMEYQTRLISEVVTGMVDVRDVILDDIPFSEESEIVSDEMEDLEELEAPEEAEEDEELAAI